MPILVIHAPDSSVQPGWANSFENIFARGIGESYAIFQSHVSRLPEGSKVVLLRKDRNKKRAEGRLVQLVYTGKKTPQGVKRYDVHFNNRRMVPYQSERLNPFGVAVIVTADDC